MKITVTAEVGKQYAAFVRIKLATAKRALVAWASRPSARVGQPPAKLAAPRERSGKMPKPRREMLREVNTVLVGDARMSKLHRQFMNIAGPTDVLTFPMDTDANGNVTAGEVYVCVPEARRQAKERGGDVKLEVLLYALHGMLHLLGYDDRTDRAYRIMHRTEDQILTAIGVGPVFAHEKLAAKASKSRKRGAQ